MEDYADEGVFDENTGEKYVEVIEEGRIVKVRESYARREGLPILRKTFREVHEKRFEEFKGKGKDGDERKHRGDDLRRPLNWKDNKIVADLVDNFHWVIAKERRKRNISRKEFAGLVGVSEETIKLVENGILPGKDFVLVNKIQEVLGINLRKDNKDFGESPRKMVEESLSFFDGIGDEKKGANNVFGDDIVLLED